MDLNMTVSVIIFAITFIFILSEKINRTVAALSGAVVMVIAGTLMDFYDYKAALNMIELDMIILLIGMMALLGMLEKTGAFQYVGALAAKLSGGEPVKLLLYIGGASSVLSMFLDNITAVILIAPIILKITKTLRLSPIPYLISLGLLSNIGGIATLVGDPPNLIIASVVKEFTFISFITHLAPYAFIVWATSFFLIKTLYRKELSEKPEELERLSELDPVSFINDKENALKLFWIFLFVVIMFFVAEFVHIKTFIIVTLGLCIALISVKADVEEVFLKVEWGTLIFFSGLFVVVGGLAHSGLLGEISKHLASLAEYDMRLCCVIVIWVIALASAIIENIPLTIAAVPVLQSLGTYLGDPVQLYPLWWAVALGVGLGGNATSIGATVNIIVIRFSEKTDTPVTAALWFKSGGLVTFASLIVTSIIFWLFFAHMCSK